MGLAELFSILQPARASMPLRFRNASLFLEFDIVYCDEQCPRESFRRLSGKRNCEITDIKREPLPFA
jgi:hypothetical protein